MRFVLSFGVSKPTGEVSPVTKLESASIGGGCFVGGGELEEPVTAPPQETNNGSAIAVSKISGLVDFMGATPLRGTSCDPRTVYVAPKPNDQNDRGTLLPQIPRGLVIR